MVIAADYPFMDILWSMIIFFVWVAWIWTLIMIISDLFRRHDTSGWAKAAWVVFLIVLPFLGVLVYLIANGHGMGQRSAERAQAAQSQFNEYVQSVAKDGGRRRGERAREGQGAARQRRADPGRVRRAEGQAHRLTPYGAPLEFRRAMHGGSPAATSSISATWPLVGREAELTRIADAMGDEAAAASS